MPKRYGVVRGLGVCLEMRRLLEQMGYPGLSGRGGGLAAVA